METMMSEDDGSVIGYMCAIDFECELGAAAGGNIIYPSIDDLKRCHKCWENCGIVEVRTYFSREIVPSNY